MALILTSCIPFCKHFIENLREPLKQLLKELSFMDNIILDESFIDFAGEAESMTSNFVIFFLYFWLTCLVWLS